MSRFKQNTLAELCQLQHQPSYIKNICILAHVDHGKTTLADCLVASNGIISNRNAGKIRYMDSRADEQERGITMKSSAISLVFEDKGDEQTQPYLINLIDSPGHVDFSSEVSTAVRLCDGAIVVVDVVEGVCSQTHAVLRQAWLENIRPLLVLNKVDRLISELKLSAVEAYYHLIQILEQVNLVTSQLFTSEAMEKTSKATEGSSSNDDASNDGNNYDWTVIEDEEEQRNIFFSPELGNVVFASAYDGWAFSLQDFANMYAVKLGMRKDVLLKTLWGDYYINMKSKRIMKGAQSKGKKTLFVQFALENIWAAYEAILIQKDSVMAEKIMKSLGLAISPRDLRHKDTRVLLQSVMSQWLPLAEAVLGTVVSCIPSPLEMTEERVETLMCSQSRQFSSLPKPTQALKADFLACKSKDDVPVIIFVSKMFPMDKKCLPQNKARPLTQEELARRREVARQRHAEIRARAEQKLQGVDVQSSTEKKLEESTYDHKVVEVPEEEEDKDGSVFIAFARVYSGTVRRGQTVYFLGPKHDPGVVFDSVYSEGVHPESLPPHVVKVEIRDLYLLMGRELESVEEVPAGNVLGLGGLEDVILKSGTLSSTLACPAFTDLYFDAAPIVRVAVESVFAGDMGKLVNGLHLLNQADPCVEVRVQETGEHVIIAAGEVHLQRCIDDLKERYAMVEVNVSKPIVPFRETVIEPPQTDMVNEDIQGQPVQGDDEEDNEGVIQASTADRQCHLLLRAIPLPGSIPELLLEHQADLKILDSFSTTSGVDKSTSQAQYSIKQSTLESLRSLKEKIKEEFKKAGGDWRGAENKIWSFGPRKCGPNILLNCVKSYNRPSVWEPIERNEGMVIGKVADFDNSVVSGFQMASLAGPLCEEPIYGVCFVVEDWWYGHSGKHSSSLNSRKVGVKDEDNEEKDLSSRIGNILPKNSGGSANSSNENVSCVIDKSKIADVYKCEGFVQRHSSVFGPLSGQLISTLKEGCRRAFQAQPQRLMAAMYKCEVHATTEVLGKLHGVLSKRFGQVLSEEMQEGTDIFNIVAVIPVIESFGFAEDIRKKTSGLASPQLKFSHWEVLSLDPFWVPTTEEEYLHFGEKADAENRARQYMNKVRKRKGLKTDEKIVEFAEKQRTLTKMK